MVRFASFIVTALLAGSTIYAAPLAKPNRKLLTGGNPDNTTSVGDPANPDNTTSVDPANLGNNTDPNALGNTTVVDPNALGNNTAGTNTTALCDSGLADKAKKKLHKGGAKGKGANAKVAAKKHGHKNNSTASGLPPCNATSGGNPEIANNATNPELSNSTALAKSSKKKGKNAELGTVKIANIARSLLGLPRLSHRPKRRLTPVTLWEDEE